MPNIRVLLIAFVVDLHQVAHFGAKLQDAAKRDITRYWWTLFAKQTRGQQLLSIIACKVCHVLPETMRNIRLRQLIIVVCVHEVSQIWANLGAIWVTGAEQFWSPNFTILGKSPQFVCLAVRSTLIVLLIPAITRPQCLVEFLWELAKLSSRNYCRVVNMCFWHRNSTLTPCVTPEVITPWSW